VGGQAQALERAQRGAARLGGGPDAGAPQENRGPAGYDEFNRAREAGHFGWPFFIGPNTPYHRYDFAADSSGPAFESDRPVNDSPNNDGARILPPAREAMIWYPYEASERWPELGSGGRTAIAGPVYRYDRDQAAPPALPPQFDGSLHHLLREGSPIQEREVGVTVQFGVTHRGHHTEHTFD
jgi:hypothetical protein